MTTRIENAVIFHIEVIPPMKTESLIREVSIIEAAIIIDSTPTIQAFDSWKRKLVTFNSLYLLETTKFIKSFYINGEIIVKLERQVQTPRLM
ncbi:hypothetical protein [Candidatus Nitrosocosmicus arcticus]|uniref:Uncharacterized protein n=1 Tax=Candidatus Nitrosocosmicus arcticus TaxID=2035267 RepID=A0A557SUT1_9ARCH|nr:hypothetical protein [Candidatus Nitrosocosmicus arcticus]TVP40358.1 hypothetical protein NARC_80084 [Candidatus Nitrosocosmicus arcticus]